MHVLPPLLWGLLLRITAPQVGASREESGASAVEYGLLIAGIAAVIVAAVFLFGQGIFQELFQNTCDSIAQKMPGGCT